MINRILVYHGINQQFLGYFYEACYSIIVGQAFLIANGTLVIFFVSICFHHQAFYRMFNRSIDKWKQSRPETTPI